MFVQIHTCIIETPCGYYLLTRTYSVVHVVEGKYPDTNSVVQIRQNAFSMQSKWTYNIHVVFNMYIHEYVKYATANNIPHVNIISLTIMSRSACASYTIDSL